ncbi:DNA topoisomerase I [Candidatus Pacearchaeota archaeon]|nr:DNA topoisomerase I [Candidatus Pacearchaeota archaeon]
MKGKKEIKKEAEKLEEFIPVKESDLKHAVEIPVKGVRDEELITIEKVGKKAKNKRQVKPKLKTRNIQEDEETEEGIKDRDYTLIITEKPQAALKIASALGDYKKYSEKNVPYYILERKNKEIIVACAAGHLFTLTSKEKAADWPTFNLSWQPNFKAKKNDWSKRYYSLLLKLAKNAKEFIVATDYDVEGEVIGWNIVRFIAKKKDAKRMKFSTLTKNELEKSYDSMRNTIDWGQAIAGETRHYLDWMYGINLSRALMYAIKKAGKFKIMSIGRVQGPALKLIVEKELEIQKFKPVPYWQVFIQLIGHEIELKYEKDIFEKKEIKDFSDLKGKQGDARTEIKEEISRPPFPFDLTSLQREAYRLFHINPARTLQIAQQLYLEGLISYPRTSSQKIPEAIEPKKIIERLSKIFKETKYAVRSQPVEGNKSDPAHPSIYPTGDFSQLQGEDKKIYEIIVKRFISCFAEDALIENKKIIFETDDKKNFLAHGMAVKKKGWTAVYPLAKKELEIETIEGRKTIKDSRIEEKETMPPHRYTPASIITELERRNLGTKATRSAIVETLYDRNYVESQSLQATPLGIKLISTLDKYSPIITDEILTREFEKDMEKIQEAKSGLEKLEEKIIEKAKSSITKISDDFKKHEEKIGKELVEANQENYELEKIKNTLNQCPVCKKGNLRILFNRRFKRSFIACDKYPECKTTFSLPPGMIKKTEKLCDKCGFPIMMRLMRGKKPWFFCFNPNCESRKEYESRKNEKEN